MQRIRKSSYDLIYVGFEHKLPLKCNFISYIVNLRNIKTEFLITLAILTNSATDHHPDRFSGNSFQEGIPHAATTTPSVFSLHPAQPCPGDHRSLSVAF